MTDEFMDSQGYFKGKGVPMRKSSGKGMRTQRKNPKGADGNIMTCSICGSDGTSEQGAHELEVAALLHRCIIQSLEARWMIC